jgi:hypothetical protein
MADFGGKANMRNREIWGLVLLIFAAALYGWVTFFFSAHPLAADGQRLIFFWGIDGDAVVGLTDVVGGLVGCAGLLLLLPSLIAVCTPVGCELRQDGRQPLLPLPQSRSWGCFCW